MKLKILNLVIVSILSIGFSACGDSSSGDKDSSSKAATVSNIGNNINSLGYYGGNTIFGSTKIENYWQVYAYTGSNTLDLTPRLILHIKDESIYWYSAGSNISKWKKLWIYGVNDDGEKLYWQSVSSGTKLEDNYIEDVTLTGNSGDTLRCMKTLNKDTYFAWCPFDGSNLTNIYED